jgi:UDP-N-acetylglucosamine--N-acetylmuramyl-(pentapeptide) pyrophosphoryl-undecaprenol N-acetylglucosamine transferase
LVFSGGGTGGHLFPALALAEAVRRECPGVRVHFLGAARGIEARVLPERGESHLLVPVRGVARGVALRRNLGVPWALARSLVRTLAWFHRVRPELVVVTGGYAGAPAGMVAALMGIPLALQEQNAVPGITTRILAPWAREIHVAYPEAVGRLPARARSRAISSGNPVRTPEARGVDRARRSLGLDARRPTVLVVGGSQGSAALNRAVGEMVRSLDGDPGFQLLWSTGPGHLEAIVEGFGSALPVWVHPTGFIHDMPAALEAADLAVSRAGAMATSEFLAWGLPAVLVPLPTAAEDHQARNASALEAAGCALHVTESSLSGSVLLDQIHAVLGSPERRAAMGRRALERGRPAAAGDIARSLLARIPGACP